MSYEVLARKYRPRTFEDMVGQKHVAQTLQNALRLGKISHAYLFAGMRGTGKTTAARVLAKALNCVNGPTPTPCNVCEFCRAINEDRFLDVLEIDGASNRSIDDIRALRESVRYKPVNGRYKVIIIDEVHQITKDGFNALLKTLEEPPPSTVFILATTDFEKVPATIVSRCQHFEFRKIPGREIAAHLAAIASKEGLSVTPAGLALIAAASDGSLRDALSLLDQAVAYGGESVGDEDLREILGSVKASILFDFSTSLLEEKPDRIFELVGDLVDRGGDLRTFYRAFVEHIRALLLVGTVAEPGALLAAGAEELAALKAQAAKASPEDFLRFLLAMQQAESGLKYASHPRIFLEALLVKLCHFRKLVPLQDLIRDIREMKQGYAPRTNPAVARPGASGAPPAASQPSSARPVSPAAPETLPEPARPEAKPEAKAEGARELFGRVLELFRKEKPAVAAIVGEYSSLRYQDGVFEVTFEGGKNFYIPTIQKDLKSLEKAASEALGRVVTVRLIDDSVGGARPRERQTAAALGDPIVRSFMNTFKAQIVSVDAVQGAPKKEGES
jgi:DNA polymerase-3 subunit gamma/tau